MDHLPFIDKDDIRRGFPHNFLPEGQDLETLIDLDLVELEHTSGTSRDRTPLILGRGWWDQQERRALRLNRFVSRVLDEFPEARRVTINSPSCSGDICYTGAPSQNDRIVGHTLFVSLNRHPLLWDDLELGRMVSEALGWRPQFLDMDPVYGVQFALYCERHQVRFPSLQFVLSSYEFVSTLHRRILERVFRVPVLNLYGSTETGHLLMENEVGEMLACHENACLELHQTGSEKLNELVVTTLTNDYMPLLRYRIGDLVERTGGAGRWRYRVHGRISQVFESSRGRILTTLHVDDCVATCPGIKHYQLVQRAPGSWSLFWVPENRVPDAGDLERVAGSLGDLLGEGATVQVQAREALLSEPSGKFTLFQPQMRPVLGPLANLPCSSRTL